MKVSWILWCVVGVVQAAALSEWGDADMEIVVRRRCGSAAFAKIKGRDISLCSSSENPRSVYDVAREQVLAGYFFSKKVPENMRKDPTVWQEGVRVRVCNKRYFHSEELLACCDAIDNRLQTGACERVLTPLGWRAITAQEVFKATRVPERIILWVVCPANTPIEKDRIRISFRNEGFVLQGMPCKPPLSLSEEPGAGSILAYKRENSRDSHAVDTAPRYVAGPTVQELLDPNCKSPYSVGLLYFSEDKKWRSALFNTDGVDPPVWWNVGRGRDVTAILKREVLRGFTPIHAGEELVKDDVSVLMRPDIRNVTCMPKNFFSEVLCKFLQWLPEQWGQPGFCLQPASFDKCQEGLQKEQVQNIVPPDQGYMWSSVSPEAIDGVMALRQQTKPTVLLIIQGETVALRGVRVWLGSDDSLWWRTLPHTAGDGEGPMQKKAKRS